MKNDKRNENEIQKMNKFLKCFTCKTEEEVKQCFDECGFWKTEDEACDFYDLDREEMNSLREKNLFQCSLYAENTCGKLTKFYGEELFQALLYFNNLDNNFFEICDVKEYQGKLFLRKRFIIYDKKVKIQIEENVRNNEKELVKIDKNKLQNFIKYGDYFDYDGLFNRFDKPSLDGISSKEYKENLDKELNKIIDLGNITDLNSLYRILNYPPEDYELPELFTNVEKYLGKYDDKLFEILKTIWKIYILKKCNLIKNNKIDTSEIFFNYANLGSLSRNICLVTVMTAYHLTLFYHL